jgi:hypothetical protein
MKGIRKLRYEGIQKIYFLSLMMRNNSFLN